MISNGVCLFRGLSITIRKWNPWIQTLERVWVDISFLQTDKWRKFSMLRLPREGEFFSFLFFLRSSRVSLWLIHSYILPYRFNCLLPFLSPSCCNSCILPPSPASSPHCWSGSHFHRHLHRQFCMSSSLSCRSTSITRSSHQSASLAGNSLPLSTAFDLLTKLFFFYLSFYLNWFCKHFRFLLLYNHSEDKHDCV